MRIAGLSRIGGMKFDGVDIDGLMQSSSFATVIKQEMGLHMLARIGLLGSTS